MVLPQYELVPKLEFVSYYYQLVLVRYTCIARMRLVALPHTSSKLLRLVPLQPALANTKH